jgi:hypothetical protein
LLSQLADILCKVVLDTNLSETTGDANSDYWCAAFSLTRLSVCAPLCLA